MNNRQNNLETGWRFPTKRISRRFKLNVDVPRYDALIAEVLNSIENDTIFVFRPDEENALYPVFNEDGEELLNERANVPVSIREWLAVGCQWIGMSSEDQVDDFLAIYTTNAHQALWPKHDMPLGPAAFIGEIHLRKKCLPKSVTEEACDAFRFVIAHELVHAFDMLKFLVPAFQNWRVFFKKVLREGSNSGMARDIFDNNALILDDYGKENELGQVGQYWPSRAHKWFKACNSIYK